MNISMYLINAVLIPMVIRQIRHGPHPGRRPCLIWYPGPPRVTLCP
jgi:hypothetical protein